MADTHKTFLSFHFFFSCVDQKGNHVIYDINRALESGGGGGAGRPWGLSGRRDIFGLSKLLASGI